MHILKWNQVGRTMLEIISVMAIIGILSVTGIYMYQTAMVSLRANDVIEEGSKKFASRSEKTNRTTVVVTSRAQKRTAYGYGLSDAEVDSSCANRIMVSVGAVNSGDRSIDTDVCMKLLSSVGENMPIKGIYLKNECTQLNSELCTQSEKISMLRFEFAQESELSIPTPPPTNPTPTPTPVVFCQEGTYNPNCQICDEATRRITDIANSCQKCDPVTGDITEKADACHTCLDGTVTPIYNSCQTCNAEGVISDDYDPACQTCDPESGERTNIDPLPPGCISCADGFGVEDRDNDSVYSPTCPQNSYIELNSDGKTGCCKACPDGKVTNGIDAVIENGGDPNEVCLVATTEECPNERPLKHESGNCYSCEWVRNLKLESGVNSFEICSNLGQATRIDENGLSVLACLSDRPLRDKDGQCWPCDTHEQINVEGVEEYCNVCNGTSGRQLRGLSQLFSNSSYSYEPRNASGSGSYCNFKCPDDKPLLFKWQCYSCGDSKQTIGAWHEEIYDCETICDGRDNGPHLKRRYAYDKDSVCARACPSDKPLLSENGTCHSCDENGSIYESALKDCESICDGSNTTTHAKRINNSGTCVLASCPEHIPLHTGTTCVSCAAPPSKKAVSVPSKSNCNVCDGSDTNHTKRFFLKPNMCVLDCRTTETPLIDYNGNCHSCNEVNRIYLHKDRIDECTAICPNRQPTSDGYCNFKCPNDKPLMGADGNCYACNDPTPGIFLGNGDNPFFKENCALCADDRYLERTAAWGSYCMRFCPMEKPLRLMAGSNKQKNISDYSYCARCDDSREKLALNIDRTECATYCNGSNDNINKKRRNVDYDYCLSCPANKPIISGAVADTCYSCDSPSSLKVYEVSDFSTCDGTNDSDRALRIFGDGKKDFKGTTWSSGYSYSCLNKPLRDDDGHCFACDLNYPFPDKANETLDACPGERFLSGNYSYPCATAERGPTGLGNNSLQCGECGGSIETVNGQRTCVF